MKDLIKHKALQLSWMEATSPAWPNSSQRLACFYTLQMFIELCMSFIGQFLWLLKNGSNTNGHQYVNG